MKTTAFKSLLAGLLTWAFIGTAHADTTYVRIGGAQAFGNAVHAALLHLFGATGSSGTITTGVYAYSTSTNPSTTTLAKAQYSIWSGTINGNAYIIKTSFTGSTDGVRIVAGSVPINFFPDSLVTAQTPTATASGAQVSVDVGSAPAFESAVPDAAAVDSLQNSTVYTSPTLTDVKVGVGPYIFVASKEAPGSVGTYGQALTDPASAAAAPTTSYYPGLTNITSQQAQALYNVGNLPLAVFTGVAYDRTTNLVTPLSPTAGVTYDVNGKAPVQVFATGRDYGSGARIIAFIETGVGANSNVVQYKPTITGSSPNFVTGSQIKYPANTINGIIFPAGSDGNTSNGNLATTVLASSTLANLGGYYVSYLPVLDATNAKTAGAKWLAYNGVPYSAAAVSDGSYSLFAFEHILYRNSVTAGQQTFLTGFTNQLISTDATILLSTLHVSRPIDGGLITPGY